MSSVHKMSAHEKLEEFLTRQLDSGFFDNPLGVIGALITVLGIVLAGPRVLQWAGPGGVLARMLILWASLPAIVAVLAVPPLACVCKFTVKLLRRRSRASFRTAGQEMLEELGLISVLFALGLLGVCVLGGLYTWAILPDFADLTSAAVANLASDPPLPRLAGCWQSVFGKLAAITSRTSLQAASVVTAIWSLVWHPLRNWERVEKLLGPSPLPPEKILKRPRYYVWTVFALIMVSMLIINRPRWRSNLLTNGGFEDGQVAWVENVGTYPAILNTTTLDGKQQGDKSRWFAWLGVPPGTVEELSQTVEVFPPMTKGTLGFSYIARTADIQGTEPTSIAEPEFSIYIRSWDGKDLARIASLQNLRLTFSEPEKYTRLEPPIDLEKWIPLINALEGKFQVCFRVRNPTGAASWIWLRIDNVELRVFH